MIYRSSFRRSLVQFTLIAALGGRVLSEDSTPADREPRGPLVTRITDGHLEIGEVITVEITGLEGWIDAASHDPYKLVPFINGLAIQGQYPIAVHRSNHTAKFRLGITPANRATWIELIGAPTGLDKEVDFSVGLENESVFPSQIIISPKGGDPLRQGTPLTVISPPWGVVSLVVMLVTVVATIWLARNTSLIRDPGPSVGGKRRPYNLGRTQATFWFLLTYVAYVVIWLITDAADTITPSLIGLMCISGGTALSEALIDAGKGTAGTLKDQAVQAEKKALEEGIAEMQAQLSTLVARIVPTADDAAARDALNRHLLEQRTRLNQHAFQLKDLAVGRRSDVSRGFLQDILSDGHGYSFPRFQILAWMMALGVVFLCKVYYELTMPEFSPTMLGLMGMSAGTYIGFKFPEKP